MSKASAGTFLQFGGHAYSGGFSVANLKARKGRDLQTGKEIKIPARKAPKFKPSANLKDLIRGKKKKK